jgi:hypothetical protein
MERQACFGLNKMQGNIKKRRKAYSVVNIAGV